MRKSFNTGKTAFHLAASLLCIAVLIAGCIPTTGQQIQGKSVSSSPLVMIASDHPGAADPAENWNFGGAAYLPHVYETMFRFAGEKSPKLVPALAAEIPTVENGGITRFGQVYTIRLKPGLKFHDGSPINAEAVIFSYQRMQKLNLGVNGISADWITQMEQISPLTVRFTLKQPFADFLNSMGSVWGNYIVNPNIIKQHEKSQDLGHGWLLQNDAGSGPYQIESIDQNGSQVILKRYKDYWGGFSNPAPIERVIIRWPPETTSARSLLENKEADIAINLPAADYAALGKSAGFSSYKFPSIMQYYLGMNASVKPLDDSRVRQALHDSFDTDRVIAEVFEGNMIKMNAAVGPGYPDVYPAKTQPAFDLDKARALLEEAGLGNGFKLKVNVLHFWPNDMAVIKIWQSDLAKIGVTLEILEVDGSAWSSTWFDKCAAGADPSIGQVSTMAVGGDYPSAWEVLAQVYPAPRLGGGKCSAVYIDNPLVNNIFANLANTTDAYFRQTLFQNLYDILAKDDAAIWIGQAVDTVTIRDGVSGYQYSFSLGGNYIPLAQMSLTR